MAGNRGQPLGAGSGPRPTTSKKREISVKQLQGDEFCQRQVSWKRPWSLDETAAALTP